MSKKSSPDPTVNQTTDPEPIAVGSPVRYLNFPATCTLAKPGDMIDVCYYESGRARFASEVSRGWGVGQWLSPAEYEAGRPRTPRELVDLARERGEIVPTIGARVVFGESVGKMGFIHTIPTRAVILEYSDLQTVDLAILRPEPPDDPAEPDTPVRTLRNVKHASTAEPKIVKQGYQGHWSWPDELIVEFGPVLKDEVFPLHKCDACGVGMNRHLRIWFGDPADRNSAPFEAKLCVPCLGNLREFFGGSLPHERKAPDLHAGARAALAAQEVRRLQPAAAVSQSGELVPV